MKKANWIWKGKFQKFFLVVLGIKLVLALFRDIAYQRYSSFEAWFSDLIPATLGLILSATITTLIVYGIYRLYKFATRKRSTG